MSYCERCGEKNLPRARYCGNCAAPLPPPKREKLQPGYGYNIHKADCNHGLKIGPMDSREKLALLGTKKYIFIGNMSLLFLMGILLMFSVFKTGNLMWKEFLEEKTGLFGPNGQFFTAIYILLLYIALLITAKPLYTRNTFNPRQLYPAMFLELLLFPILGIPVWRNLYFGDFLGTTLSAGGYALLLFSLAALIGQIMLIGEYRALKKRGIYSYVAN